MKKRSRRISAGAAALAFAAAAVTAAPSTSAAAPVQPPAPQGSTAQTIKSPQAQLDRVMALQPGGTQVSDNAVVWGGGDVVLVVPSAGESTAPEGLGENVRTDLLRTPAMRELNTSGRSTREEPEMGTFSRHGCPGGLGWDNDYYCFYQYRSFEGRRVQFTGKTSRARASEWGFNNGTTSWVSNDVDCDVFAYDTFEGRLLWRQPENSVSAYVGSQHDNKMSWWTCSRDASGREVTRR